jgi:hypothetical protein
MINRHRLPRKRRHLSWGRLQALHDGAGGWVTRVWARVHLRRCASCAAKWREVQEDCARTTALLGLHAMSPDTDDAWERFAVQTGGAPTRSASLVPRVAALAAAGIVAALISQTVRTGLVARMYQLSAQVSPTSKSPSPRDRAFAQSLAMLEARGIAHRVSDVCCADRDGEGPADDGVLTVQLKGSRSPVVILYEDTKRAGRFEPGDVVLIVSRPESPVHGS